MSMPPRIANWSMLLALVAMWGSGYMFIKMGVETVPPTTLVACRILIGAFVLYAIMRARGLELPPVGARWWTLATLAIVGNCAPFLFITWGQQFIDSALAAILVATMPLATLVLAHFFVSGERMNARRATSFASGFLGIVVLTGPAALAGVGGSAGELIAQASVLAGALCYAANSVIARRAVSDDFIVASAAVMIVASIVMVPTALVIDRPWALSPSVKSVAAILWLGIGPTAIATIVYFRLIAAAGPTFMSLVNYLSPIVALVAGILILHEAPGPGAIAGLAFILTGIALSRRS